MEAREFTHDSRVQELIDKMERVTSGKIISDVVDDAGNQYVDLVMEGGGVLGIALLGYTYALEKSGIRFLGIGGTSAGSIAALLLAAVDVKENEKSEQIAVELANQDLFEFVDGPESARRLIRGILQKTSKIRLGLYYWSARGGFLDHLGFNPGDKFLDWLTGILQKREIKSARDLEQRMAHLPAGLRRRDGTPLSSQRSRLVIVAAEVSTETKVEFPRMASLFWERPDDVNPACFVRASMSVPYFFHPYRVKDIPQGQAARKQWKDLAGYDGRLDDTCTFVDGGIMSNFPINTFHNPFRVPSAPTLGVKLGTDRRQFQHFEKPLPFGGALFNAARHTLDYDFIRKNPDYRHLVAHIDTGNHKWLDFELTDEAKVDLFRRGVEAASTFLERFDWENYKSLRESLIPAFSASFPQGASPMTAASA